MNYSPDFFQTIADKFIDPSRHEEFHQFIQQQQQDLRKRKTNPMEQLFELIPHEKKKEGRAIIDGAKRRRIKHDNFEEKLKKYLTVNPPVPSFEVNMDTDFNDICSCIALIKKLSADDHEHQQKLLRSAAYQGKALEKILSIYEHKKKYLWRN